MNISLYGSVLALCLAASSPAFAQAAPKSSPAAAPATGANPCPTGNPAIVRTSKIKAGGTLAGFDKAVADHAKWYTAHGYSADTFMSGRVMTMDPATRTIVPSGDTIMTFHAKATDVPASQHDAAWDAYVAEYNANADIVNTTYVCMAK